MRAHRMRAEVGNTSPPILAFGSGSIITTTSGSHTHSNISIGSAFSDRRVIIGLVYRFDPTTETASPAVTVAGVSCNLIVRAVREDTASNTRVGAAIYISSSIISTGITASVVVSSSLSQLTRSFIGAYTIRKASLTLAQTNTSGPTTGSINPSIITSAQTANQVGIAVGAFSTTSTLTGYSVSGPVSTNYNTGTISSSSMILGTITGSGDITFNSTGTGSGSRSVLAVWS